MDELTLIFAGAGGLICGLLGYGAAANDPLGQTSPTNWGVKGLLIGALVSGGAAAGFRALFTDQAQPEKKPNTIQDCFKSAPAGATSVQLTADGCQYVIKLP